MGNSTGNIFIALLFASLGLFSYLVSQSTKKKKQNEYNEGSDTAKQLGEEMDSWSRQSSEQTKVQNDRTSAQRDFSEAKNKNLFEQEKDEKPESAIRLKDAIFYDAILNPPYIDKQQ